MMEPTQTTTAEYSAEERSEMLRWAHEAVAAAVRGEALGTGAPTDHLGERRGAFTSLHIHGKLRGCIGFIEPLFPLWQTVYETARAAATQDPRFLPIQSDELSDLAVEISVMSPLHPIEPEQVEVGKHGLLVSRGNRRGLLLPQVATQAGWTAEEFLAQTCIKAGLPPDAWRAGAKIEAFTAEVFGEDDAGNR